MQPTVCLSGEPPPTGTTNLACDLAWWNENDSTDRALIDYSGCRKNNEENEENEATTSTVTLNKKPRGDELNIVSSKSYIYQDKQLTRVESYIIL